MDRPDWAAAALNVQIRLDPVTRSAPAIGLAACFASRSAWQPGKTESETATLVTRIPVHESMWRPWLESVYTGLLQFNAPSAPCVLNPVAGASRVPYGPTFVLAG